MSPSDYQAILATLELFVVPVAGFAHSQLARNVLNLSGISLNLDLVMSVKQDTSYKPG